MNLNSILLVDGYKVGHKFQYAPGTSFVFSNFTARSDRLAKGLSEYANGEVLWAGLYGAVQEIHQMFNESFFRRPKEVVVAEYERQMNNYLGAGSVTSDHIAALHDLGHLPVVISALPEGSLVPVRVPLFTIYNSDPAFAWVTNMLETLLSSIVWQSVTNATVAFQYRMLLEDLAQKTGAPSDFVQWQAHDFSFRGMAGPEAATRSGAMHLMSFLGTDTIPAIGYLEDYYGGRDTYVGGSVPASEHSVSSTNILALVEQFKDAPNPMLEAEKAFFKRYITEIYPSGVCSYVADTYDFWAVLTEVAPACKAEIMNRTPNALGLNKVVFRPDSGDPVKILTGYKIVGVFENEDEYYLRFDGKASTLTLNEYSAVQIGSKYYEAGMYDPTRVAYGPELTEAEVKGAVEVLWDIFGGTVTDKGFKVLDQHVGLIYGDSITLDRAKAILTRLQHKGFASCNVVFGVGSYTYQYNTRDTYGFAIKSTAVEVDGEFIKVFKDPKTDSGVKKSAKGMLVVNKDSSGKFCLEDDLDLDEWTWAFRRDCLKAIYIDGEFEISENLAVIRSRISKEVQKRLGK